MDFTKPLFLRYSPFSRGYHPKEFIELHSCNLAWFQTPSDNRQDFGFALPIESVKFREGVELPGRP